MTAQSEYEMSPVLGTFAIAAIDVSIELETTSWIR